MRIHALVFLGVWIAVLGAGCGDDGAATEVIVMIDADDAVRDASAKLHLMVDDDGGARVLDQQVPTQWPMKLALAPRNGDARRKYSLTAEALDDDGAPTAFARLISGYVAGEKRFVTLLIEASCLAKTCSDPDLTCHDGQCVTAEQDPNLFGHTHTSAPTVTRTIMSGSNPDGGTDASVDTEQGGGTSAPHPTTESGTGGVAGDDEVAGSGGDGEAGSSGAGGEGGMGGEGATGGTDPGGTGGGGGTDDKPVVNPCLMNHGGCDALVGCTPHGAVVTCGACPTGYDDALGDGTLCTPVECGQLLVSTPLSVSTDHGASYDSVATYACAAGYVMSGSLKRTCQQDGTWSGDAPSCVPVDCGPLSAPALGSVMTAAGTTYGETATYACAKGYGLSGPDTRTCGADGSWSGSEPLCTDFNACAMLPLCTAEFPCQDLRPPSLDYTCRGQYADWTPTDAPHSFVSDANLGTVSDSHTGLMWQRTTPSSTFDWTSAQSHCLGLTTAGYDDWRLPSKAELESIIDFARPTSGIDMNVFQDVTTSATEYWWTSSSSWAVTFYWGYSEGRSSTSSARVRCVRSSEPVVLSAGAGGAPPGRYVVTDGTVYDTFTKLTWQQAADTANHTFANAQTTCSGLSLDGGGWRLPKISELLTLVDPTHTNPALDRTAFAGEQSGQFWTSSPMRGADNATYTWSVNFNYGGTTDAPNNVETINLRVRCVR